jgi:hypothetical protein
MHYKRTLEDFLQFEVDGSGNILSEPVVLKELTAAASSMGSLYEASEVAKAYAKTSRKDD